MDSSLLFKIAPNRCSGGRFLAFAICLVVNLEHCHAFGKLECICEYQLTTASGSHEKFKSEWCWYNPKPKPDSKSELKYMGDHVLILFSGDMVRKHRDYKEASFEFQVKSFETTADDDYRFVGTAFNDIKVEECGVHVFYVDKEADLGKKLLF
ncbi:hypothetical protein V6N13_038458 [Hibiscus sabdariffa]|uniref:Uncharacterized protein n=1 Tax=Hibiscus sabdariffa TaxID=183260 RepID=A0ABR2S276_9ROSI